MLPTRLLVLGVVRFAQPVHGYDVRRELLSWQLEEVTHVKPGSIYSALRTLERDGLIVAVDREQVGGRPERTTYELTAEGEKEFHLLLRTAWWTVELGAEPLIAAMSMFPAMPRDELIAALDSRIEQLRGRGRQWEFMMGAIRDGDSPADGHIPDHVREILLFLRARVQAEVDFSLAFRQRLRNGAYVLGSEGPWAQVGPGRGLRAADEAPSD